MEWTQIAGGFLLGVIIITYLFGQYCGKIEESNTFLEGAVIGFLAALFLNL